MIVESILVASSIPIIKLLWIFLIVLGVTLGTGIVAPGAIGTELTYVTRRAYIPKLVVQIYKSTPLLTALVEASQMATGGVSSVTVPVQGSSYVTHGWSDYAGNFTQPSVVNATSVAEWNLKLSIVAIPFLGMEGLVQMDHAIIPLVEARMNDAYNVIKDTYATALYGNTTSSTQIEGLPAAIDDGTNVTPYAGISRSGTSFWDSVYVANSPDVDPTRALAMQYVNQTTNKTGEMPTFGVVGLGTWTKLATDFLGLERYNITPQNGFEIARTGFRAIDVAGVPIYADPYCTEGRLYLINTNYLSLYFHEYAAFNFTGFVSLLSQFQLGYVGAIVTVLELVNTKPKVHAQIRGLTYLSI